MKRATKDVLVGVLAEKIKGRSFYLTDSSQLNVAHITLFRARCREGGMEYRVARNTLLRRALQLQGEGYGALLPLLTGPSALLLPPESVAQGAKVIRDFREEHGLSQPILKGAYVGGEVYVGDEALEVLSRIRSKQELLGEVVALLQAPVRRVLASLSSGRSLLAGFSGALLKRKT